MTAVNKIDSNATGLAYALEAQLGLLPGEGGLGGTPVWYQLQPNSYADFGGQITTVAPRPINSSRQRRKGVTTDLDASGGINHDLSFHNLTDLMQGVMFAAIRQKGYEEPTDVNVAGSPDIYSCASTTGFLVNSIIKGIGFTNAANNGLNVVTAVVASTSVGVLDGQLAAEASPPAGAAINVVGYQGTAGDLDVDVSGDLPVITSTSLDFTTLGLVEGQWIYIGGATAALGFANAENNGFKRIRTIAANALTIDKSDSAMVTEASTTETVQIFFGDVLKNESSSLIVRRTYNIERLLGAPDDAAPADLQSEVIIGAVANEFTLNVPSADLVRADISFIGTDNQQRDSTTGEKQSSVQTFPAATEFNTSSDVSRINLAAVSDTNEAPTPLFAYVTEATLRINNNVSPNKAVATLGAFDLTAGVFEVGGNFTAYFADVAAVEAVRNNTSVTFDIALVKDNTGIVYDMPLISLGDGRLNVEIDEPITLPLSSEAASGEDIDSNLAHTLLITYFNYLPTSAG